VAKSTIDKHASVRGVVKGNVAYMSPEQIKNEALDGRSDIFSLGVVLFELLSGTRAFQSSNDLATLRNILAGRRSKLSELRPPLDKALVAIVDKALETDRARRFPIAGELERALEDFAFAQRLRANPTTLSHVVNQVRTEGGEKVTGAIVRPRDSRTTETVRGLPEDTAVARRRTPPRPRSSR
jgi:serine/threonine-protein kinase